MDQNSNTWATGWLRGKSEDVVREHCARLRDRYISKCLPGQCVSDAAATSVETALQEAGASFEVAKRPLLVVHSERGLEDENAAISPVESAMATVRTDTNAVLGVVGTDYGIVQTSAVMEPLGVLVERGDARIMQAQTVDDGARVRVTALIGISSFPSITGQPNDIAHFAMFEAGHNGRHCSAARLYSLRLQCLNGMTSQVLVESVKLRHTSQVENRLDAYATELLSRLLDDAEKELATFRELAARPMARPEFEAFARDTLLGGELPKDASKRKVNRQATELEELLGYFDGGNQGAGATAWGAYQSVTRWIEAKRERMQDGAKAARRFESQLDGDAQRKVSRALRVLTR